ncbi:unnamed protein product [Closterium sp. Naga37s-1]|nr:unnamed protein product [Closterium sp. Naga37s-1]
MATAASPTSLSAHQLNDPPALLPIPPAPSRLPFSLSRLPHLHSASRVSDSETPPFCLSVALSNHPPACLNTPFQPRLSLSLPPNIPFQPPHLPFLPPHRHALTCTLLPSRFIHFAHLPCNALPCPLPALQFRVLCSYCQPPLLQLLLTATTPQQDVQPFPSHSPFPFQPICSASIHAALLLPPFRCFPSPTAPPFVAFSSCLFTSPAAITFIAFPTRPSLPAHTFPALTIPALPFLPAASCTFLFCPPLHALPFLPSQPAMALACSRAFLSCKPHRLVVSIPAPRPASSSANRVAAGGATKPRSCGLRRGAGHCSPAAAQPAVWTAAPEAAVLARTSENRPIKGERIGQRATSKLEARWQRWCGRDGEGAAAARTMRCGRQWDSPAWPHGVRGDVAYGGGGMAHVMRGRSPCCAPSLSAARLAHSVSTPAGVDSGDDSTLGVSSSGGGDSEAEASDPWVDGVQRAAGRLTGGQSAIHDGAARHDSGDARIHSGNAGDMKGEREEQEEEEEEAAVRDREWMREAVEEAQKAAAEGEVPVGAVMVMDGGALVARAHNLSEASGDPTAHAEMLCIRAACTHLAHWRQLQHCTLYVSLEPCPMCAGAILQARVGRLVWGAPNPLLGADGSWIRSLQSTSPCSQPSRRSPLNTPFARLPTLPLPASQPSLRPPPNPPFALLSTLPSPSSQPSLRPPLNLSSPSSQPASTLITTSWAAPLAIFAHRSSFQLFITFPPLPTSTAAPCCPMLSSHSLFPPRPSAHGSPSHRLPPGSAPAQGTPGRRRRRRGRRTDGEAEGSEEESGVRGAVESEDGSGEGAVKEGGVEAGGDRSQGVVRNEVVGKSDEKGGGGDMAQGGECVRSNGADRGDDSQADERGDEKSLGSGRVEVEGLDKARGSAALMGEGQRALDHPGVGKGGPVHPFHPHVRVTGGVLGEECAEVMREFFRARRKQQAEERRERKAREGLAGS